MLLSVSSPIYLTLVSGKIWQLEAFVDGDASWILQRRAHIAKPSATHYSTI
jgi:hypothetical protein